MKKSLRASLAVAAAGAVSVALATPAHADYAPSGADAVGVGSDTVQYLVDFGADGDASGDLGFNSGGGINKLVSFDATPDANARAGYLNGSTNAALLPLNPTIVLRSGTNPVQRPNGSGSGIAALLNDAPSTAFPDGEINFVRASRLPTSAEETSAGTAGFGGLHVVRLGTENLQMAALKTGSNAVPLTALQLFHVYQCDAGYLHWNDANIGGTSSDAIAPIVPQSGSGTRSTFLADLTTASGGTAPVLGSCVKTSEENDPTAITSGNFGTPADAIAPFSGSRLALFDSNYFHNPATPYPGGAALAAGIKMETGASAYSDTRGLFVVFKQDDLSSTAAFEPGGTKNMIQTLFSGSNPYFKGPAGLALVAAAGATPAYKDCGLNPTSC